MPTTLTVANVVSTTTATSTFGGNVSPSTDNAYSLGVSGKRWSTLYSHILNTGDLVFGNNFDLLEATDSGGTIASTTGAAMIWKNQNGQSIFQLDQNGNLAVSGDICTSNVNCFSQTATARFCGIVIDRVVQPVGGIEWEP